MFKVYKKRNIWPLTDPLQFHKACITELLLVSYKTLWNTNIVLAYAVEWESYIMFSEYLLVWAIYSLHQTKVYTCVKGKYMYSKARGLAPLSFEYSAWQKSILSFSRDCIQRPPRTGHRISWYLPISIDRFLAMLKCLIHKNLQNVAKGGMAPTLGCPARTKFWSWIYPGSGSKLELRFTRKAGWIEHGMHRHSSCYTPIGHMHTFCRFLLRTSFKTHPYCLTQYIRIFKTLLHRDPQMVLHQISPQIVCSNFYLYLPMILSNVTGYSVRFLWTSIEKNLIFF